MGYNTLIETPVCIFSCKILFSHSFCPDTTQTVLPTPYLPPAPPNWWKVKIMQLKALLNRICNHYQQRPAHAAYDHHCMLMASLENTK